MTPADATPADVIPAEAVGARLRAVLSALREELKPELVSPQTRLRAELIDMVLTRMSVEADGGDAGDLYWSKIGALLPNVPAGAPAQRRKALADVLANAQPGDAAIAAAVAAIAAAERDRRVALENGVATAAREKPAGNRSVGELSVSADTFTAYLRGHFPSDPAITADAVILVPGGRSKGTILLDLTTASGPRQIVIRKDFEISVTGTSVAYEYPIVKAAFDAGLPVPEPLWLEPDASKIGGAFIAFERVQGKAMGTLFQSDASPAFVRHFAAALARLHALDLKTTGLAKQLRWGQADHPVRSMIDDFYARYRRDLRPNPLMDAAFAWLRLNLDAIGNTCALVHGDAGLHNTLGDGDRLTALLDWEFSHAGDPAEDLAYCRYLIERILPWDEFMSAYRDAGGAHISPQRMQFFTIWRTLHLSILTGNAREMFETGRDQDLRLAAIGYNTFPKQLRDLAADLAAYTEA